MTLKIEITNDKIAQFCRDWQIKELSIFGSALREDFRPDSDVDVLVAFDEQARWNLFDLMRAESELEQIFGREVDLVEKQAVRNPFRRQHILNHHEVIYAT
jgi:predicted nucleotidyltransferase